MHRLVAGREGRVVGDCGQLVGSANEGERLVAERIAQVMLDLRLKRLGAGGRRLEDHVPSSDVGSHIGVPKRLKQRAQLIHLDGMPADIDRAQQCDRALHLGTRTQAAAHMLIHDLCQKRAPGTIPVVTSDGLNQYFYALTAHFGCWVDGEGRPAREWQVAAELIYGQVKKHYRRRRLVRVTQVMRCGTRAALRMALTGLGLSGRLNTAFVERLNLTLRQSIAALARRTWATLQEAPQLLLHVEWWRAYYHFVRPHESLREALAQPIDRGDKRQPQRYRQRTPAMAAGLTHRRSTVREVLTLPLPPAPLGAR